MLAKGWLPSSDCPCGRGAGGFSAYRAPLATDGRRCPDRPLADDSSGEDDSGACAWLCPPLGGNGVRGWGRQQVRHCCRPTQSSPVALALHRGDLVERLEGESSAGVLSRL
jgi:hypothetical protein